LQAAHLYCWKEITLNEQMKDKIVVITGATSGIGQVAAEILAGMGARIVQVARDPGRGEAALKRLNENGGIKHSIHYADLSLVTEIRRVAAEIADAEPRIDVLINNAGAMFSSRHVTQEGLECTFALNHLSYFVLTQGLRERLIASAPARIVNTASDSHEAVTLDFKDLQSVEAYGRVNILEWMRFGGPGFRVYGRSKLCNILFTRELARQLAGTGVTANSWHPGFVATRFGDHAGGLMSFSIGIAKHFALTPPQGAETLVFLASSTEVAGVTGQYFHKCRSATPSGEARDQVLAGRLWTETISLIR
jgi:NAD(P)-dependent dehydrogenase (short-subunit alcohol dehydrogenase family)